MYTEGLAPFKTWKDSTEKELLEGKWKMEDKEGSWQGEKLFETELKEESKERSRDRLTLYKEDKGYKEEKEEKRDRPEQETVAEEGKGGGGEAKEEEGPAAVQEGSAAVPFESIGSAAVLAHVCTHIILHKYTLYIYIYMA